MAEIRHIDFRDQIARNKRNSIILFIAVLIVLSALGYVISSFFRADLFLFSSIWIIITITYILVSYYNSDKIAIAATGAKPASPTQYRQYYHLVEGLTIASGLPMPRLYILENEQINAFATGSNPKSSAVCVTTGALQKLDKQELEGVLAHELTHIKNYDIRFVTLVAVMVGLISIISEIFLRSMWYGSGSRDRDNKGAGWLIIIGIILAIVAPIVVKLVQLAISRKREFMADAGGVEITRYPKGLINALKKIADDKPMKVNQAVAPLFFSDPLKNRIVNLFQTHPPLNMRIRILEAM